MPLAERGAAVVGINSISPPSAPRPAMKNTGMIFETDLAARFPEMKFDDATYDRSAKAFDNPDHVAIVIQIIAGGWGWAEGRGAICRPRQAAVDEPGHHRATITMKAMPMARRIRRRRAMPAHFPGKYQHRDITGGASATTCRRKPRRRSRKRSVDVASEA